MLTQIAQQREEQGMQQKAEGDARKMKEKGYPVKDIAEITELTEETIQA